MTVLRELFQLDPEVAFLNHGSFGATPRPVMEAYQAWQRQLERQPVHFLQDELFEHLEQARRRLGVYLNAPSEDLVFIPNDTFGVNLVARSLPLKPGDEVLSSDHEYGACENTWHFVCARRGALFRRQSLPLPMENAEAIVDRLWAAVTPRTRVIFLSHISSPTAQRLPVEAICARARQAGILTVVDGAHAPGQIPLDLGRIGADFYVGNCHKWMCAPKGSAFLYALAERQDLLEPLVVSWGWGPQASLDLGSRFLNLSQWWGTVDPSAWLAVPAAIQFQIDQDWPSVQKRCHRLLEAALEEVGALTGLPGLYRSSDRYAQMAIAPLPPVGDLASFKAQLYQRFRVEVPLIAWENSSLLRISIQGYNTPGDVDRLISALSAMWA